MVPFRESSFLTGATQIATPTMRNRDAGAFGFQSTSVIPSRFRSDPIALTAVSCAREPGAVASRSRFNSSVTEAMRAVRRLA
jgi:hypothetical protein